MTKNPNKTKQWHATQNNVGKTTDEQSDTGFQVLNRCEGDVLSSFLFFLTFVCLVSDCFLNHGTDKKELSTDQ